ncbi:MAG: alanine racemase [Phycisphaerae bacterium]|nr:alanine racemase [Phycisphaerae bacterium]
MHDSIDMQNKQKYLTAEISASAIRANIKALRSCAGKDVKFCSVVKCDCYGHGLKILLPIIADASDFLATATPAEALQIRDLGYDGPLLVLFATNGPFGISNSDNNPAALLTELLQRNVTLTVTGASDIDLIAETTRSTAIDARVHAMIDTGMARSGMLPPEAPGIFSRIRNEPHMRLSGAYTHFATADENDKTFAHHQISVFNETLEHCNANSHLFRHAANSAATIDLPQAHYDMLRPGISLFGYQPSDAMQNRPALQPALKLRGHLMQVKTVSAGSKCGYGLTFECKRETKLGLVPIGYGDGYLRSNGNRAVMRIDETEVPVIGRVSMNQTILDITDHPTARLGSVVEIISADPAAANSVENLARLNDTIPHEITTRLGSRIQRVLVD